MAQFDPRGSTVAAALGVEVQWSMVEPADTAAARSAVDVALDGSGPANRIELTTVSTVAATFHRGVLYSDFGIDYTTYALGRPEDRCQLIPYR